MLYMWLIVCGHVIKLDLVSYYTMCMRVNAWDSTRPCRVNLLAMKLVVLLLLGVVATANAKFQFTEEWELWKKVSF